MEFVYEAYCSLSFSVVLKLLVFEEQFYIQVVLLLCIRQIVTIQYIIIIRILSMSYRYQGRLRGMLSETFATDLQFFFLNYLQISYQKNF